MLTRQNAPILRFSEHLSVDMVSEVERKNRMKIFLWLKHQRINSPCFCLKQCSVETRLFPRGPQRPRKRTVVERIGMLNDPPYCS